MRNSNISSTISALKNEKYTVQITNKENTFVFDSDEWSNTHKILTQSSTIKKPKITTWKLLPSTSVEFAVFLGDVDSVLVAVYKEQVGLTEIMIDNVARLLNQIWKLFSNNFYKSDVIR